MIRVENFNNNRKEFILSPAVYAASALSAQLPVQDLVGGRQVADGEEYVLGQALLEALIVAQGEQEQVRVADLVGMT